MRSLDGATTIIDSDQRTRLLQAKLRGLATSDAAAALRGERPDGVIDDGNAIC